MRTLLIVLLLANGAFFAWAQGWLAPLFAAPRHTEREPQRLAAQVRPESVTVLAPLAASAALLAAQNKAVLCLEAGPFSPSDISNAEEALSALLAAGSWAREPRAATTAGAASSTLWLRVAAADAAQQGLLLAQRGPPLADRFKPCVERP